MALVLGPKALSHGYRANAYATIGSTSTEALARAQAGDPGRLWIVAGEQTGGHGRRGRPWQTPAGNLAASLLLRLPGGPAHPATLGFAAGLALHDAIEGVAPTLAIGSNGMRSPEGGRLRLKWPNDVLLDGAKVAGILLETAAATGTTNGVVIGFGVNVRHRPADVSYPVTSLFECGSQADAGTLFAALSDAWIDLEAEWDCGRGMAAMRDRWLERAAGLGAAIAVRQGDDLLRGIFETIDDDGRLVVRSEDGSLRQISAGDVHFGSAATAAP